MDIKTEQEDMNVGRERRKRDGDKEKQSEQTVTEHCQRIKYCSRPQMYIYKN